MIDLQKKYKSDGIGAILSDIEGEFLRLTNDIRSLEARLFVLERANEIENSLLQVNGSLKIKPPSNFFAWAAGDYPLSNNESLSVDGTGRNVLWGADNKNSIVFTIPIQVNSKTKITFQIPRSIKTDVFKSIKFLIGNRILPITIEDDAENQQFLIRLDLSKIGGILYPPVLLNTHFTPLKQDILHTLGIYSFNVQN
jgi:hypothetical protein